MVTVPDDPALQVTRVHGWPVADATRAELAARLGRFGVRDRTTVGVCLHVSALSTPVADNEEWARHVDVAYADGWSVAALARLAGARRVERSTLTDLAWVVLDEVSVLLGRRPRVALVGGPPGLATRAAAAFRSEAEVVYTCDGYADDDQWASRLEELEARTPDVTFVGLGYPLEVRWCVAHRNALPRGLVLTCGGFFGYLAGEERRAPGVLRQVGLEWAWRVLQAPRRLLPRYAKGALRLVAVSARILGDRRGARRVGE